MDIENGELVPWTDAQMPGTESSLESGEAAEPAPERGSSTLWRRRPTNVFRATKLRREALLTMIDDYFQMCWEEGTTPTAAGMAGHAGYDSVAQLVSNAVWGGKKKARGISRGLLAIASYYEELGLAGSKNAMTLLSSLPQVDTERRERKVEYVYNPRMALNITVDGATESQSQKQLTAQQAYLQLIKHHTYEEAEEVIDTALLEDGSYSIIDVPGEDKGE